MNRTQTVRSGLICVLLMLTATFLLMSCAGQLPGTLIVKLYFAGADPDEQTAEDNVSLLLETDPAIDGKDLYRSGPDGTVALELVPAGVYELRPALAPDDWALTVTVPSNETASHALPCPIILHNFVLLNDQFTTAFSDADFRRGMATAIDREYLAESLESGYEIASSFLPYTITTTTLGTALNTYSYDPFLADTLTASFPGEDFTVETNEGSVARETAMAHVVADLSALSTAGAITGSAIDFGVLVNKVASPTPTFEAAVLGISGGNDLSEYFEKLLILETVTNVMPDFPGEDTVVQAVEDAIASGSRESYAIALASLNNELIISAPMIPLYQSANGW